MIYRPVKTCDSFIGKRKVNDWSLFVTWLKPNWDSCCSQKVSAGPAGLFGVSLLLLVKHSMSLLWYTEFMKEDTQQLPHTPWLMINTINSIQVSDEAVINSVKACGPNSRCICLKFVMAPLLWTNIFIIRYKTPTFAACLRKLQVHQSSVLSGFLLQLTSFFSGCFKECLKRQDYSFQTK